MTQATHTPGPWQIGEINSIRVDGCRIKGFPISGQGQAIARVWAGTLDQIVSFGNQEANARLIAAAPIMYAFVAIHAESSDTEARRILEMIDGHAQRNETVERRDGQGLD